MIHIPAEDKQIDLSELKTECQQLEVKLARGYEAVISRERKDPHYQDYWIKELDRYTGLVDRIRTLEAGQTLAV